jgi:hypothetical protein
LLKNTDSSEQVKKSRRQLVRFLFFGTIICLIGAPILFFLDAIDELSFFGALAGALGGFLVTYYIKKLPEPTIKSGVDRVERAIMYGKISSIFIGAVFGGVIAFFVTGSILWVILGGPIPEGEIGNAYLIFSFVIAPPIGGFLGYFFFKRSKYARSENY